MGAAWSRLIEPPSERGAQVGGRFARVGLSRRAQAGTNAARASRGTNRGRVADRDWGSRRRRAERTPGRGREADSEVPAFAGTTNMGCGREGNHKGCPYGARCGERRGARVVGGHGAMVGDGGRRGKGEVARGRRAGTQGVRPHPPLGVGRVSNPPLRGNVRPRPLGPGLRRDDERRPAPSPDAARRPLPEGEAGYAPARWLALAMPRLWCQDCVHHVREVQ